VVLFVEGLGVCNNFRCWIEFLNFLDPLSGLASGGVKAVGMVSVPKKLL